MSVTSNDTPLVVGGLIVPDPEGVHWDRKSRVETGGADR